MAWWYSTPAWYDGTVGPKKVATQGKRLLVENKELGRSQRVGGQLVQAQTGCTAKEAGDTTLKRVQAAEKVQTKNYVALKEHIGELRRVLHQEEEQPSQDSRIRRRRMIKLCY